MTGNFYLNGGNPGAMVHCKDARAPAAPNET